MTAESGIDPFILSNILSRLTGCDTTSSFFGIGKKTVLKKLKDNIDEFADLNKLCLFDSETSINVSRNFVARLYDQKRKMKSAHDNLNRLRVKIAKQKDVSLAKLPPCEASFVQHVLRASLQTYTWMKSDTAQPPARIICSFHHHYLHLQFESTGCNMHQSLNIDIAQCRSDLFSTNTTLRTRRFAFTCTQPIFQKI
jgi:hypothetical protein